MKFKLNQKGMQTTAIDLAAVAAGAVAGNQFLDFNTIFKPKDPENFFIKHQGGVKAVGAVIALNSGMKMAPWMKMVILGIGVGGAIKEARLMLGTTADGKEVVQSIGNNDTKKLDELLQQARTMGRVVDENVTTSIGNPNQYAAYTAVGMGDQLIPFERY